MTVTALYHDPKPPRTYGNRGEWIVVLAYPQGNGFLRHRFDSEELAEAFAATFPDARQPR